MRKLNALICLGGVVFCVAGCKPEADRVRDEEAAAAAVPAQEPQMPNQVAKAGVGVQGNSLDSIQGNDPRMMLAGPVKAYFQIKERIVFDIQVKPMEQTFNAINGRNPKSHEEYMKEIVGQIQLPKLPDGMVYRYHPETNELWVEAEKAK